MTESDKRSMAIISMVINTILLIPAIAIIAKNCATCNFWAMISMIVFLVLMYVKVTFMDIRYLRD